MTDTSGLPSAIGIDAVECVSDGSSGVTVRVTGRWRRRRPEWQGPAMLVLEAGGQRHRVPAMPEPPSLTGTLPGTWRMSFAVPAELGDHLGGPVWLALGAVLVPLAVPRAGEMGGGRVPADAELVAAHELRGYVVAAQSAWRRAREAESRAAALEGEVERLRAELGQARHDPERLQALIAERERAIVVARQALHAEAVRGEELLARVAEEEREAERLRRRARALARRVDELQRELRRMRRGIDEARHEAAAARAAAARAEQRVNARAPLAGPGPSGTAQTRQLSIETALSRTVARLTATPAAAAASAATATTGASLQPELLGLAFVCERSLVVRVATAGLRGGRLQATNAALRAELATARRTLVHDRDGRSAAQARIAELEGELARRREHAPRALTTITDARYELGRLREPSADRQPAESSLPASGSPPDLSILARVPQTGGAEFEAARLAAALDRLRAQHAEEEEDGAPPNPRPTLAGPARAVGTSEPGSAPQPASGPAPDAVPRLFRALAREDPAAAGRLVLGLLPAQRLAYPRPVAYDLVLGAGACVRVTVGTGAPEIELAPGPRPLHEIQFRVEGDPARLARLLAAGPVRRRLARGLARRQGERPAFRALQQLPATPLWPHQLQAAGVRLDAALTLRLAAVTIAATHTEAFSVAHRASSNGPADAILHVAAGGRATVSDLALESPATTTIVCPAAELLGVLLGLRGADVTITGDDRPLELILRALTRA